MISDTQTIARGLVESLDDDGLVLRLPQTDYRLRLKLTVPASEIAVPPGKRIRGTIRAEALRMHPAAGGGRFIEPIWGEPRVVAGTVLAVDEEQRTVLVDAVVPFLLTAREDQDFSVLEPGGLVNGHVRSGATFTPAGS
ncbi:MAG: hypothetical protein SYC29_08505 [Planctomycetota bacterium]|nr:hypothetical protein [Planctomycetota bacterium]